MVSSKAVDRVEVDLMTEIKGCDSCKYAKATQKPIKKVQETLKGTKFGDEIHSDVWGHHWSKLLVERSIM